VKFGFSSALATHPLQTGWYHMYGRPILISFKKLVYISIYFILYTTNYKILSIPGPVWHFYSLLPDRGTHPDWGMVPPSGYDFSSEYPPPIGMRFRNSSFSLVLCMCCEFCAVQKLHSGIQDKFSPARSLVISK